MSNDRFGFATQARWLATAAHASILASLLAGVVASWMVLALVVALLAHPVPTMSTLELEGARGLPTVVRHGTASVVAMVLGGAATRSTR